MTDNEEVVMTPLLAPEGTTVLKVERVPRGHLDPRTVHYVAGGRYEGIIINRAANERPDIRPPHVRRKFTCYIGGKVKGEPMREQRQLRFWFRLGTSDWDPMTDKFLKELLNPHLFPRDYIGYTKRILQLLQGFPTVVRMELEMRPARPGEEDQQHVVRRMSRQQKSQPPPPSTQEDYRTWHAPRRGGSRGEIHSAVVPVVITHTRSMSAPPPVKPPPEHPGLSRRGIQVLWVARRYRVLKLLEDAYPNSVTAEELMRFYRIYVGRRKLMDVVSLTTILQWLAGKGLVREVEKGRWMRLETTKSAGHKSWTHSTEIVTELPILARDEMPTVAIVTLLYAEKLAVDAMIDNTKTYVWRRPHDVGEGQVITLGNIGHIRVVSTKLPKPGEGESAMMAARNATTRVIGSFSTVTRVLLVGVAGGIAHFTDDRHHVRRGDVIVAKPKQARSPIYIYCTGTERGVTGDYRFASRNWVTKDEVLENLIQRFQSQQRRDPNFSPWENNIDDGLNYLSGGDLEFSRPIATSDRLIRLGPDGFIKEVHHPTVRKGSSRHAKPDRPVVHYDVIGGGEALLGDYNKRRTFAMLTGAKAIDPGYQPVLEAIEEAQKDSVAIIRGIADYSDGRSDAHWQPYASLAAAAFARALILELPNDA